MIEFQYYNSSYIQKNPENPIKQNLSFKDIECSIDKNTGGGKKAVFASYITEFDCKEQTEWWFTIKDSRYDLSELPSKKRYEITKAKKYCFSKKINPNEYILDLFSVYEKSFLGYSECEKPRDINISDFKKYLNELLFENKYEFYACFLKEANFLIGFLIVEYREMCIGLKQLKTVPDYEKFNSNASLLDCFLTDINKKLENKKVFVSNGSRNIRHKTNFNAYLEKYFGFRKAYAKLRIVYRFPFGFLVAILKPFGKFLEHTKNPFLYNIYCVLKMDSYKYKE